MKTRSLVNFEHNRTALDNSILTNEQPKPNIDDIPETTFYETIVNEISTIPKIKQKLQDGKITTDEYNTELNNLKDRLAEIVKKMNVIRGNVKAQDKKIENQSINFSIAIKNIEDNIKEMEQDNKNHLKEKLNIDSKAHVNEYEIHEIQR